MTWKIYKVVNMSGSLNACNYARGAERRELWIDML
jgi:hypothetical protein